jgi:hypothetical protein
MGRKLSGLKAKLERLEGLLRGYNVCVPIHLVHAGARLANSPSRGVQRGFWASSHPTVGSGGRCAARTPRRRGGTTC